MADEQITEGAEAIGMVAATGFSYHMRRAIFDKWALPAKGGMMMKRIIYALGNAVLIAILLIFPQVVRGQGSDSEKVSSLFTQINEHASLAEHDADVLETYTRSGISWQGHASRISEMKEHVNDLIRDYQAMESLRAESSPWQKEAIDRLEPLVQDMGKHLTATIEHQREHPTQVRMKPYMDYVRANKDYAHKTAKLIHDIVDYGDARAKADLLERQLQLPTDESASK